MATLQAARAKALGMSEDVAKSFGLNRAIFYAAAKRGFKGGRSTAKPGEKQTFKVTPWERKTKTVHEDAIGNEVAYYVDVNGKKRYTIGGDILEPKDYDRQIERRFGDKYNKAWQEALNIVEHADHDVLESQSKFYNKVYKPNRDELAKHWTELASTS